MAGFHLHIDILTEDPLGLQPGESNLYRYVGNSPPTRTDPSGLDYIHTVTDGTVYWVIQKDGVLNTDVRSIEIGHTADHEEVKLNDTFNDGGEAFVNLKEIQAAAKGYWNEHPDISGQSNRVQDFYIRLQVNLYRYYPLQTRDERIEELQSTARSIGEGSTYAGMRNDVALAAAGLLIIKMLVETLEQLGLEFGGGYISDVAVRSGRLAFSVVTKAGAKVFRLSKIQTKKIAAAVARNLGREVGELSLEEVAAELAKNPEVKRGEKAAATAVASESRAAENTAERIAGAGAGVAPNRIPKPGDPDFIGPIGARPANSPNYSVGFEAKLKKGVDFPGVKDTKHFQEANRQLHEAFQSDPKFAQDMEKVFPGIVQGVKPGPKGAFPSGPPT